jgi:type VI secretion system protein ImpF
MQRFTPTVLDRLFDETSSSPSHDHLLRGLTLDQMKDSVARDVEALLNTRLALSDDQLSPFPNARHSVLSFGMSDFVGRSLERADDRRSICELIERAIALHEPRLRDVVVTLAGPSTRLHALSFSVTALLVLDPATEPISFDALLQPTTQQYSVTASRRSGHGEVRNTVF